MCFDPFFFMDMDILHEGASKDHMEHLELLKWHIFFVANYIGW